MNRDKGWEFLAVPMVIVVLGGFGILVWAGASGPWAWLAVGAVVLAGLILAAVVMMRRPSHPAAPAPGERPAGAAAPRHDGVRRVLVIADAACAPGDLSGALATQGKAQPTEVYVIAPALGSRTARLTGDEHAYQEANAHLEATLAALAQLNVSAAGRVGPHDPLQAVDDGLREFAADEIVFAVPREGDTNWLERGVVDEARTRYPITVTELRLPAG